MKKYFKIIAFLAIQLLTIQAAFCLPKLNSYPTASATIYLDFDGHFVDDPVWNMGEPFNCLPADMTDIQITEVFNRVAEDYRPFDINITTDSAVFLSASTISRIRIIVTSTSDWYPGVGGVAYTGSFTWGDDTPAFVFSTLLSNSTKMVAEACSHESGHTLGLSHQSKYDANCNLIEEYNSGTGSGATSWAPIMGSGYYRNMTGWNNGSTPYACYNKQDNLSLITGQNGFSYRKDDYTDNLGATTFTLNPLNININGIVSTPTDQDAFKIVLPQRNALHLKVNPFSITSTDNGSNLDIKLQLYDAASQLIRTYDPVESLSVSFDTVLNAGTYFLMVDGTGNKNTSDYGSLGSYTISGNIATVLPIKDLTLNGKEQFGKHELRWTLITDDPVKSVSLEVSVDGRNFNQLAIFNSSINTFSYTPDQSGNFFYRIKGISTDGQIVYSNIITLKNISGKNKFLLQSAFVKNEAVIVSTENYQFFINDMNGRKFIYGKGDVGINRIDMNNLPDGIYIVAVLCKNEQYSFKIIKQH